ncbi:protein JINGUBANG [Cannabis sativa]|uniref:protein JINGUBANG n=1 Tax=Cannabis sativa TaxID=3483 RepID=UPI0029CA74F2|nr:protein JINGUBANG [Cannabis sativa]
MEFYNQNSDDILSTIYEERSYTNSIETPRSINLNQQQQQHHHHNHNHNQYYDEIYDDELYHNDNDHDDNDDDDPYYFSPLASSSPNQAHNQARPSLIPPPSPESPWTCSPLQTPSPSLLYHCIASLHRHDGTIYSVAVSNGVVFTGSDSTRIRAWRPPDCVERGLLKSTSGEVRAILAYGDMLFTSHKDLKIRTWNFAVVSSNFLFKKLSSIPRKRRSSLSFQLFSSKPKLLTERHKDCVSCLAYYHAEGILYTGSHDRTVKAWRVSTRKCVDSFVAHEDNVNGILVNQEDGCVFTCSSDGSVKIWRRIYRENSHTLTMILRFQPSPVNAIALSSSSSSGSDAGGGGTGFLYSGSSDGTINFWEKERMSYRFNHGGFLQGHRFAVLCVVAVEKMVFSGSEDTTIRIWRREEGNCLHECLAVLDGHRGPVRCLAACLERENLVMGLFLIYSASLDRTFKVWRVKILPEEEPEPETEPENRSVYCGGGGGSEFSSELDRNDSRSSNNQYYYENNNTTSPVLSPSWVHVKKSAQVKHFFQ